MQHIVAHMGKIYVKTDKVNGYRDVDYDQFLLRKELFKVEYRSELFPETALDVGT